MTAAIDNFGTYTPPLDGPGQHAAVVSPSDTVDLTIACRAIWVGVTGNVTVNTAGGESDVTFTNVPVGWFQQRCTRVWATGTTASSLVAVW